MLKPASIRSESTTDLINRQTSCRFSGNEIKLDLSLGLFSSAGVDAGSLLLLKTLAKELKLNDVTTVLDVGCGVGTLGLAVAKRCPDAEVFMVDRDELAVLFTRHNADLNSLNNVTASSRLMLEGPHRSHYDLIITNFPAKAGEPVLRDYLGRSLSLLSPGGTAAIVIVYTLADLCRNLIEDTGGRIVHSDVSKQHTVFHYKAAEGGNREDVPANEDDILTPYIRNSAEFKIKRTRYNLETVWNISDFDNLSWRLKLMGELINREPRYGNMVFWSPGQGHLPVAVARQRGAKPERITLCGRDRLEMLISERNLKALNTGVPVELKLMATPADEGGFGENESADLLVTDINPIPRSEWGESMKTAARAVVKSGGIWAVTGRSSDVAVLTKHSRGWTVLEDKRTRGWRAVVYRKN